MPASIHPALQLRIVLDEDSYRGGDSVEMARRFKAVAPTEVVRATKGSQHANVLRFDIAESPVTEESVANGLWRDAFIAWLDEEFSEASALVVRENNARRINGQPEVPLTWAEVRIGRGPVFAIRMIDSSVPLEAAGFVARAQELLMQGAFGVDEIAAIRMPACASIEAQRADAHGLTDNLDGEFEGGVLASAVDVSDGFEVEAAAKEVNERAREGAEIQSSAVSADEPTDAEIAAAVAEAEAALRSLDDPMDEAAAQRDSVVGRGPVESVRAQDNDDTSGEACARVDQGVPDTLDYRIWNIAYADGTSVRFDSVLGEALLD